MHRFNFEQLVGEPTDIGDGLIDQVYVSKDFPVFSHQYSVFRQVLSAYCSDHGAIKVTTNKLV